MKTRAFNAVCPLEIGDMVAVTMEENGKKTAYYMPQGIVIEINRAAKVQKVTDIAAVHYCRHLPGPGVLYGLLHGRLQVETLHTLTLDMDTW